MEEKGDKPETKETYLLFGCVCGAFLAEILRNLISGNIPVSIALIIFFAMFIGLNKKRMKVVLKELIK